jgi:hypothetical protein
VALGRDFLDSPVGGSYLGIVPVVILGVESLEGSTRAPGVVDRTKFGGTQSGRRQG